MPAMKKKTKTVLSALVVLVVLVVGAYFGGLFSVIAGTPPTCTFTDTVKTCTYNYDLAASRAASSVVLDFDGGAVQGTELLGTQTLQPVATYSFNDPSSSGVIDYNRYYMYAVPSNWVPYDVVVTLRGTDTCTATSYTGDSINVYNTVNVVNIPWALNQIVSVSNNNNELTANPSLRNTSNFYYDLTKYSTANIYELNQANVGGMQTVRCYKSQSGSNPTSESQANTYSYDSVIANSNIQSPGNTKFIVRIRPKWRGTGGTVSAGEPVVSVAYHEALYPTNVKYTIGSLPVETFSGPLSNGTRSSLDIADQINLACNRGFNSSACTVPITITSTSPGNLWISKKNEVLKVATQDAVITELQSTLQQKTEYINQLNLGIDEKNALIQNLEATAAQQGEIISSLNVSIQEKAALIAQLGDTAQEQAVMITQLNANIADQATVINELTKNLAEKAYYVSQLQVENSKQADLVKAMQESFSNQGEILSHLNKTVSEDAVFIQRLSADNSEQAEIIAGLDTSLEKEKAIVAELTKKIADEQQKVAEANALLEMVQKQKGQSDKLALLGALFGVVALVGAFVYVRRKK